MSLFLHPVFYLLRHGRITHDVADLVASATDAALEAEGQHQAEAAVRHRATLHISGPHMSPLSPRAPDGRGLAPLAARASRRSGAPSGRAELGYRGGQSRAILNREATPEHGESAEVFRSRIKPACTAISAPTLGTAPPLPIAHSATAREIVALRPVPFIRPPNYALTRYHRGSDGSWRADPPELPALPSL